MDPVGGALAAGIDVAVEIHVVSARHVAAGESGPDRRALAKGREVYSRDVVRIRSVLEQLIETGRAAPPRHPDTSVLPARWPATNGITATDALIAERRENPR